MAAEDAEDKRSLEVLQAEGVDETCVTFVLHEQDHTLGNALRYMIMKNPEVVFSGYSITHPSEDKINLRIQTKGVPAIDSFRRGLCELTTVCEHVLATFETENCIFSRPEAIGILHHGNLIGTDGNLMEELVRVLHGRQGDWKKYDTFTFTTRTFLDKNPSQRF